MKHKRELNPFDVNKLKIAKDTLRYSNIACEILGGMTRAGAEKIVKKFGNKHIKH